MKLLYGLSLVMAASLMAGCAGTRTPMTAEAKQAEPLTALKDGNARYVLGDPAHPNQDAARRAEVAQSQKPYAIVVSCADSRVAPELLFDEGLGDLFVVRTAGQAIDPLALGSIEYGAAVLQSPLLVVLGHERCGAVDATMKAVKAGKAGVSDPANSIDELVTSLVPPVEKTLAANGDLDAAIKENARYRVGKLKEDSPVLKSLSDEGKLKIVPAYYDLDTGAVEFLDI